MSDLRYWVGGTKAELVVLVARNESAAARLAGLRTSDLPFKFRARTGPLPYGVGKPGVYRSVGGVWVRDEPAEGPPDLEEP